MLKEKHAPNQSRNDTERDARRDVRTEIKKAKLQYRNKLEEKLGSNNLKAEWHNMRTMTGMVHTENKSVTIKDYDTNRAS